MGNARPGAGRDPAGRPPRTDVLLLALVMLVPPDTVLVIAHRGASGYRPEHTLEAYALAVEMGADVIEPDLVFTRDGVLVARHENDVTGTTDIAQRPEFASRRTTKVIDGEPHTGWFTEDLTLAEIRALRATERLPALRGTAHDGQFLVPTFAEILDLAARLGAARGRPVGVYPETKHPSYFEALGLPFDGPLLAALHGAGYRSREAPVWIQSFETANLKRLRAQTDLRLVQLAFPGGTSQDGVAYDEMTTPEGLARVAAYADAVGVAVPFVLSEAGPTRLAADAHAAGLAVHVWTVRAENAFLPPVLRRGADPAAPGDLGALVRALAAAGADGLFCDHPDLCLAALGR